MPDSVQLSLFIDGAASIAFKRGLDANSVYQILCSLNDAEPSRENIGIRTAIQRAFASV